MKKSIAVSLASVLLASAITVPVSASTSFTPTSKNFAPLFDFDTIPGTYTDGYKPGSRNDTVGDSKSQKCIAGEGLGLTYTLTIKSGVGIKKNALKLDVATTAPQAGAWCPVTLHTEFGPNKFPPVSSMPTDFIFWVDTTGYKDCKQNYKNIEKGINMYVQETDIDKSGNPTEKATAWKVKCKEDGGYILYEDGKGGWTKKQTSPKVQNDFYLPADYKGWIKIPISNFVRTDWSTDDTDGKFNCRLIQIISLGMGNYENQGGSTVIFDEFGFVGNFSKTTATTAKTTAKATEAASDTSKTDSTGSSVAAVSETTAAADVSSNLDNTGSTVTETTAISETTGTDATGTSNKKGTPWAVVIPVIIVVVLAGAGVGGFFLFKKIKK